MALDFSLNSIRKRNGRLIRVVAVFFLVYTGADLFMPQYFCGAEEMAGLTVRSLPAVANHEGSDGVTVAAVSRSDGSVPGQPSDQAPHEEDCFCCCAHILPTLSLPLVGTCELKSPPALLAEESHLSPTLLSPYHPPRFA